MRLNKNAGPRGTVSYVFEFKYVSGVASSMPAQTHNFMEIDHEIISSAILLSFKKGGCQLQAVICARSTGFSLVKHVQGKNVVR